MTPEEKRELEIAELKRMFAIEQEHPIATNEERLQMIADLKAMKTINRTDLIQEIEREVRQDEIRILTPEERRLRGLTDGPEYGLNYGIC